MTIELLEGDFLVSITHTTGEPSFHLFTDVLESWNFYYLARREYPLGAVTWEHLRE